MYVQVSRMTYTAKRKTAATVGAISTTTVTSGQQIKPRAEMCESSLAQRRAANLPKLKELGPDIKPSMDFSYKSEMADIDYRYSDTDCYENELAELYTYSEMEDWAIGLETFNKYTDHRNISQTWKTTDLKEKKRVVADLIQMLESTESSVRLEAARLFLYLLQGAFGDFRSTEEDDNEEVNIDKLNFNADKGTGGKEHECLVSGAVNAFFFYEQGLFASLCSMLLYEIQEPFDVNFCADRSRSRQSSMSNSSRSASNIDLADSCGSSERRSKKSATLADNESIRIVLNSLYHLLESIRREDWLEELADYSHYSVEELLNLRKRFLIELEEPLETVKIPLVVLLFDMMPSFARGLNPHYPMKKVLVLIWKILLANLGGFEELKLEKNRLRKEAGLPIIEDTIEVASQLKAIRINCDGGILSFRPPVKERMYHPPRSISRQLACASGDGSKDEDEPPADSPGPRRRGGSSDEDDGNDGLPGVGMEEEVIDDKNNTGSKLEDSSPPPDNYVATPTVLKGQPRFAGNIAFQEFHGRGDLTPKAGSPRKIGLPWAPKVKENQIEQFLQQAREKYFGYQIPGDLTTTFCLPKPLELSLDALKRHLYKSLSEIQIAEDVKFNKFPFTQKEAVKDTPIERLYTMLLPAMGDYLVALLKILLAALPSSKSRGDALSILSDVLTPETDNNEMLSNSINLDASTRNVLEEHVRVAIDIARHKEVMIKAISGILIILFKWLRINHIYQYESVGQHLIMLNCVPLMLKFLDQNMVRYIQAKNELAPFNFPAAPLFFARNREEWPTLNAENVDDSEQDSQSYFIWRNVFSSINIVRLLNKITKGRQPRTMMLVVFKSAPILKRCLRVKCGIFQLYCLKLLKSQCRFLGRQWRKSNMDVMSAIYTKVRHRLNDDWAYANDTRNKQWDFQNEEKDLKLAVERFHSRRYSKLYPQFKLDSTEAAGGSRDYFDLTSMSDFEPVDNCLQSILSFDPVYSERFKRSYEKWLEHEVFKHEMNWEALLESTKGVAGKIQLEEYSTQALSEKRESQTSPESRNRISTIVAREKTQSALEAYQKLHFDDTVDEYDEEVQKIKDGILNGSRSALARAITLVESKNAHRRAQGHYLLKEVMANESEKFRKQGASSLIFRIGISGAPGVGKSTFIEALGMELVEKRGKKVAVLTVDPTSATTGGSILGDLTRMQNLSRHPHAYIRQSPTSGSLGGVTRGIHEAIILCEAAGYDIVLIETVGVGQSEITVSEMCDLFCLLLSPAHGDELQGVKRGIMEQSDLLVVTKADGEMESRAKLTQAEYISALKFMRPKSDIWKPEVLRASVYKQESVENVCDKMFEFWEISSKTGHLIKQRNEQLVTWMWSHVQDEIINMFKKHPVVQGKAHLVEREIRIGKITPGIAAEILLRTFFGMPQVRGDQNLVENEE